MRTNINIDDELLAQAMRDSGATTKKQAVEVDLKFYVQVKGQAGIRKLKGIAKWEGDLEQSRLCRFADDDEKDR